MLLVILVINIPDLVVRSTGDSYISLEFSSLEFYLDGPLSAGSSIEFNSFQQFELMLLLHLFCVVALISEFYLRNWC